MDMGSFQLFLKLIKDDYRLSEAEVTKLKRRMLADDREFERVWEMYKAKARKTVGGVDGFQSVLQDLLS